MTHNVRLSYKLSSTGNKKLESVNRSISNELDEFKKFLDKQGFSKNTIKTLASALHTILESGKEPDDLLLSQRSRSTYRRAYRLYKVFKDYESLDTSKAMSILRRSKALKEEKFKKLVGSDNFPLLMIKLVDTGKVYVSKEDHMIIYVE